jgi:hypothetical protein
MAGSRQTVMKPLCNHKPFWGNLLRHSGMLLSGIQNLQTSGFRLEDCRNDGILLETVSDFAEILGSMEQTTPA